MKAKLIKESLNESRFKDDKPELTVGELIIFLQNLDPNLPVGKFGHYGEFNAMDKSDFYVHKNHNGFEGLDITTPYIGEEPE